MLNVSNRLKMIFVISLKYVVLLELILCLFKDLLRNCGIMLINVCIVFFWVVFGFVYFFDKFGYNGSLFDVILISVFKVLI